MTESDDDRLLRLETSHRIKNQLTIVSSILALSADETDDDGAAKKLLSAADRVRAVATVHRLLLDQDEAGMLPIDVILAELCAALNEIYPPTISFAGDAADTRLPGDTAMRLAMIIGELVGAPCQPSSEQRLDESIDVQSAAKAGTLTILVNHEARTSWTASPGKVGGLIVDGFAKQIGALYQPAPGDGSGSATIVLTQE